MYFLIGAANAVEARFSSAGGGLLLCVEWLTQSWNASPIASLTTRAPDRVELSVSGMVAQRIYGLALSNRQYHLETDRVV